MRRRSFLNSSAALLICGCSPKVSSVKIADIIPGGEPLRSAFNRDAGKVRIVLLVSPT
jgi:hypothetical protein